MTYSEFNPRPYEAHRMALDLVPPGSRVLDLGCATGYIGRELGKKSCTVVGVDNDRLALAVAKKYCEQVLLGDLNYPEKLKLPAQYFDVILCLDVIEHLMNRRKLLSSIKTWLAPKGKVILTTPNIAHVSIRWKLLLGDFSYSARGIMDESHVHFFTQKTIEKFLTSNGYKIMSIVPTADFGQLPFLGRVLRHLPKHWQHLITRLAPTLLGVQFVMQFETKKE